MSTFTLYPAIDLRAGRVVRLQQGDRTEETAYYQDPVAAAIRWVNEGATWLHVINLDGAFGDDGRANLAAVQKILAAVNGKASVQFGGGVRDLATIDHLLRLGVKRVILGTAAVRTPALLKNALATFGGQRIVLGVDAHKDQVRVSGWLEVAELTPRELIQQYIPDGLETVIYTNIQRDGMQTGVDVAGTLALQKDTGTAIIASGGVGTLADIQAVKEAGLAGVIVGKALYENQFTLTEALAC